MVSGKKCYWNEEVSPRNSASPAGVHHLVISNNPFYPIPFPRMEKIQFTPTLPQKVGKMHTIYVYWTQKQSFICGGWT